MYKTVLIAMISASAALSLAQVSLAQSVSEACFAAAPCPGFDEPHDTYVQSAIPGYVATDEARKACFPRINNAAVDCAVKYGPATGGRSWKFSCESGCYQASGPNPWSCPSINLERFDIDDPNNPGNEIPVLERNRGLKYIVEWEDEYKIVDCANSLLADFPGSGWSIDEVTGLMSNTNDAGVEIRAPGYGDPNFDYAQLYVNSYTTRLQRIAAGNQTGVILNVGTILLSSLARDLTNGGIIGNTRIELNSNNNTISTSVNGGHSVDLGSVGVAIASNFVDRILVTATGQVGVGSVNSAVNSLRSTLNIMTNEDDADMDGYLDGILFGNSSQGTGWSQAAIWPEGIAGWNGDLVFGTDGDNTRNYNPTERVRITNQGNVGIGTSNPNSDLHVNGSGSNSALFRVQDNGSSKFTVANNGGATIGAFQDNPPANGLFVNGNVGIGTSSPAQELHLYGSGNQDFRIQSSSANLIDIGTGADGHFLWGYGDYPTRLATNGSERMRVDGDGQVGVGTTSPNSRLHVNSSSGENAIRAQVNGSTKFHVNSNGGVSVGTNLAPQTDGLRVKGNATAAQFGDVYMVHADVYPHAWRNANRTARYNITTTGTGKSFTGPDWNWGKWTHTDGTMRGWTIESWCNPGDYVMNHGTGGWSDNGVDIKVFPAVTDENYVRYLIWEPNWTSSDCDGGNFCPAAMGSLALALTCWSPNG